MHILPNGDIAANQSDNMIGHTVNINEARMRVKGGGGEWLALTGAADDRFTVGDQTSFMPKMVITIKAESEGLNRMLEVCRGPSTFPINVTMLAKRPKRRRHARGGLRRLIPARVYKYTAHGVSGASGGAIDAPWTFTMPVTKAT